MVDTLTASEARDIIVRAMPEKARHYGDFVINWVYEQSGAGDVCTIPTPDTGRSIPMPSKHTPSKFIRTSAGQVEAPCGHCGRTLYVAPSRVKYFTNLYCDRQCRSQGLTRPVEDRFWEKVQKLDSGCWRWTAGLAKAGYGSFNAGGRPPRYISAHDFSYELHFGPVPEGLELDHTCRNRWCVNPDHLEPVTHKVNVQRGMSPAMVIRRSDVCAHGHPRTPENTYIRKDRPGAIECLVCRRERRERGTK